MFGLWSNNFSGMFLGSLVIQSGLCINIFSFNLLSVAFIGWNLWFKGVFCLRSKRAWEWFETHTESKPVHSQKVNDPNQTSPQNNLQNPTHIRPWETSIQPTPNRSKLLGWTRFLKPCKPVVVKLSNLQDVLVWSCRMELKFLSSIHLLVWPWLQTLYFYGVSMAATMRRRHCRHNVMPPVSSSSMHPAGAASSSRSPTRKYPNETTPFPGWVGDIQVYMDDDIPFLFGWISGMSQFFVWLEGRVGLDEPFFFVWSDGCG